MTDSAATQLSSNVKDALASGISPEDSVWLGRITYGVASSTLDRYLHLGRQAFLAEQLNGENNALVPAIQASIDAMDISQSQPLTFHEQRREALAQMRMLKNPLERNKAQRDILQRGTRLTSLARRRNLLRAIYSPAQLREQMVWFWLNHFSVHASSTWSAADYSERAIRPHALGYFRNLVMATLQHPVMLSYLNNNQNQKGRLNENYARELMELHTLGVDGGYTQQDVQALTRILTGVGIDGGDVLDLPADDAIQVIQRDGFLFNPRRHDKSSKLFLGQTIVGGGFEEVERALDLILAHPACAAFVSRRMAQYFLGEDIPAHLVKVMTECFQNTNGNIASTLEVLFNSPEFVAHPEKRFKDPFRFVVSSARLAYDGLPMSDPARMVLWVQRMGQGQFSRITPDGFPLADATWQGSGALSTRFEAAINIAAAATKDTEKARQPLLIASPLYQQMLVPRLSTNTRNVIAQARDPEEAAMLVMASPEFNRF